MEDNKKVFKISLTTLILIVTVIVLLVVVIIMGFMMKGLKGYADDGDEQLGVISDKKFEEKEFDVKNKVENKIENSTLKNTVSNIIENSTDNSGVAEYIGKVVENRGYTYDAQYTAEKKVENEYEASDGNSYSISDIRVPFINMNSEDAETYNSKIEELYQGFVNEFKVCSENKNSFIKVAYETYTTSNIISIFMVAQRGKEGKITEEYFSYNFDALSGEIIDYEQACRIAGIQNIDESVSKAISSLEDFDEYILDDKRIDKELIDARNGEIDYCKSLIYAYYQDDLSNNRLVYFLDNNLKLNIVINVVLPAEGGNYDKPVVID